METKRCSHCAQEKPLTEFNKKATSKDGYRRSCRACDQQWRKEWAGAAPAPGQNGTPTEVVPPSLVVDETQAPPVSPPPPVAPKVIGRIGGVPPAPVGISLPTQAPPSRVMTPQMSASPQSGPTDEEQKMAEEYAAILNKKLSVRQRAIIMVKIAKNFNGANAALALRAMSDINLATGVVTRAGAAIDMSPMFIMPEDAKMATK